MRLLFFSLKENTFEILRDNPNTQLGRVNGRNKMESNKKKRSFFFFFPFNVKHMYYCQPLSSSESATRYVLGESLGADS